MSCSAAGTGNTKLIADTGVEVTELTGHDVESLS